MAYYLAGLFVMGTGVQDASGEPMKCRFAQRHIYIYIYTYIPYIPCAIICIQSKCYRFALKCLQRPRRTSGHIGNYGVLLGRPVRNGHGGSGRRKSRVPLYSKPFIGAPYTSTVYTIGYSNGILRTKNTAQRVMSE